MELWDYHHLLFSYAFVDIAIRSFNTITNHDLSLLIRFSVIEVKQKEVATVTSVLFVQNFENF